jgi:uncharacterized cupin superfamily protein
MEKASVSDVDPFRTGNEELDRRTLRPLTGAVGAKNLAVNHYELAAGERFSNRLHTHLDQEEVFYVLEGTATFRTEDGTVELEAGEAIRFAPGEYQTGYNDGDERVRALALGAPGRSTEIRVRESCEACGEVDALAVDLDREGLPLRCPECGAEYEN